VNRFHFKEKRKRKRGEKRSK